MHKNRILFFTLFLLVPGLSWSQSNNPVGGHFGVKVGASLTRVNISGISLNIPKQALVPHFGVMYRYRQQRFVLQPEVLLALKGATFQVQRGANRETTAHRYYYLSAPLLLGYIPTEGLTLQAGPEFSYALNAGTTTGPGRRNDLGVAVGIHYDFLDLLDKFSLNIRYVHGFTNVSPEPLATYRNRTLQISVVYNLYHKTK